MPVFVWFQTCRDCHAQLKAWQARWSIIDNGTRCLACHERFEKTTT